MSTDSEAASPATVAARDDEPPKPEPEDFEPPVAWLFGREFIASLKYVLLYTAFKGKLDARDWMNPNIIPTDPPRDSHAGTPTDSPSDPRAAPEELWQRWGEAERDAAAGEFWFDYISDTGDGQKAVYSIAYLCMSDLAAGGEPRPGDELELAARPDPAGMKAEGKRLLPRGTFLLVGGDTSYHISDYATIAERFWKPFRWAYRDLFKEGAASVTGGKSRLLLGIPGNHDYYDSLDGFNRQFRRPSTGDAAPPADCRPPLLAIPTFERAQEGSYLALRLPFGWWLWGMDTEAGEIDYRQWEFFKDINERHAPAKLIVATPEPTTVFGKRATADANQSKTFAALGLERPFLEDGEQIGANKCRLDLSGDIHHYARHWGTPRETDESSNYASVVAGGGGAFFHPTHTTVGEVEPEVVYPPAEQSRVKVADELFKFWNIMRGGFVWLFGALIALVFFFAATFPFSTRDAVDTFPPFVAGGLSTNQLADIRKPHIEEIPRRPFWADGESLPADDHYVSGAVLLGLSLVLLGIALAHSAKLFEKEYDPTWSRPKKIVTTPQRVFLWALVFASFASLVLGIRGLWQNVEVLTRLGRSLIILLGLAWSVMAVVQSVWYAEWLFDAASRDSREARRQWPLWLLMILAVLGFGSTVWFFGRHESAYLVSDIVVLVVVALAVGGLTFFAVSTGGGLKRGAGKVAFGLLGATHGLLQLAVPFLLVRKGHLLWATLAMAAVVLVFKYLGRWLAKKRSGWPLAAAWVALGAAMLAVPFVLDAELTRGLFDGGINAPAGGWQRLGLCLYAAAAGAILSCVLFGWYLAVALAFNGHNNEAGGAARVEGFKQFVRFRLTRERLTGYVVAFDVPGTDGRSLRPKIVDVFHVSDRPASSAAAAPGGRAGGLG